MRDIIEKEFVTSNAAKVTDTHAVREILRKYDSPLRIRVRSAKDESTGILTVRGTGVDDPWTIRRDRIPARSDFKDRELWIEAINSHRCEHGRTDFDALLLEVAPYLTTPLVIQDWVYMTGGRFGSVSEWSVQPQGKKVETKDIYGVN